MSGVHSSPTRRFLPKGGTQGEDLKRSRRIISHPLLTQKVCRLPKSKKTYSGQIQPGSRCHFSALATEPKMRTFHVPYFCTDCSVSLRLLLSSLLQSAIKGLTQILLGELYFFLLVLTLSCTGCAWPFKHGHDWLIPSRKTK